MVGSTSEVLESSKNINDIHDIDLKNNSLFMLNTDTENIEITNGELLSTPDDVVIKSEIEEQSEDEENNALERFIIVEEAVEEVITNYDEHILEICQDDKMDVDQYEDFGYESLSSPEYDYNRTHYAPHTLTNLLL